MTYQLIIRNPQGREIGVLNLDAYDLRRADVRGRLIGAVEDIIENDYPEQSPECTDPERGPIPMNFICPEPGQVLVPMEIVTNPNPIEAGDPVFIRAPGHLFCTRCFRQHPEHEQCTTR